MSSQRVFVLATLAALSLTACRPAPKSSPPRSGNSSLVRELVDTSRKVENESVDSGTAKDSFIPDVNDFRQPADSGTYSWTFPTMNNGNDRFTGRHVRHPSGLMVLWFDTATRATEDTPAGTAHVDSLVVAGLQHGEYLALYCNSEGRHETWKTEIVGILRDTTNYVRPRMAWMLDTVSFRIRAIPADGVLCSAADLFGEGDDA